MNILINIIILISTLIGILVIYFYKEFNNSEKTFALFLIFNALFEIIAWFTINVLKIENNLLGLHVYTFIEFICIGIFAIVNLRTLNGLTGKILLGLGSVLIIANSIFLQDIYSFNSNSIASVKVFTIITSIIFFYDVLSSKSHSISEKRPTVYFFTAIFLNACTTIIWYLYSNEMMIMEMNMWLQLESLKLTSSIIASVIVLTGVYYAVIRTESDII